ncbi:uncharacterized protein XM38_012670 [Halomicronema hongdechloris C2206]|uniref:Prepilin-type N-terminal cleavage/methylation domain-containing protein n=1 Tax=Halomicronema hongdechloris C2206 TaxID=1641165 RepID=A0A1Z3HJ36_9CYAN|nr:prepilin-type N-terminal cleavage/methylation domain-containing protein [Halomicronema hongdechloris]ASC70329.1 uncharacterized protein XM38_012670 [Halomicronema hongdechloris C2206]
MVSRRLGFHLYHHLLRGKRAGFTLLEVLVSLIIASIVVSGLLYLVVELLQINRREEALTETQTNMQRAMTYITRDAQEAVFVYSTPTTVTSQLDDLPAGEPILAFWRLEPLDSDDYAGIGDCSTAFSGTEEEECNTLKVRHSTYNLVVYLQQDNAASDIWQGPSRIIRYELPKYADVSNLTTRDGYADPTTEHPTQSGETNSFSNWTADNSVNTDGFSAVLVDYVDLATATPPSDLANCPSSAYERIPSTPADGNSFFVCVRGTDPDAEDAIDRLNQDLIVYLRGNATTGRPGLINTYSEEGRLPTLQAQILIRGILNKQPNTN